MFCLTYYLFIAKDAIVMTEDCRDTKDFFLSMVVNGAFFRVNHIKDDAGFKVFL